ncbi:MAG: hypothetical protein FD123_3205 [Bacteroidetes bacterium]|nr:MAG: hypothetical protein FD123_3205 [Bacteroidota bacterium]
MSEFDNITPEDLDNLEKYAPTLAKLGRQNPFLVPDGYFDALPAHIHALLSIGESARDRFLGFQLPDRYFEDMPAMLHAMVLLADASKNRDAGLVVPEGYFENLTGQIEQLSALSAMLDKEENRDVPEGYFEQLNSELATHLALDNLKQDKENMFVVPAGYFDSLASKVRARLAMEQVNQGSDADVPEGYFDNFAARLQARIREEEKQQPEEKQEAKVISLFVHIRKNVRTYAAAASLVLVLGIGWVIYKTSGSDKIGGDPGIVKNDDGKSGNNKQPVIRDSSDKKNQPDNIAGNPGKNPGTNTPLVNDTANKQPGPDNVVNNVKKDSANNIPDPQYTVVAEMPATFDADMKAAAIEYLAANEDDLGDLWDEIGGTK